MFNRNGSNNGNGSANGVHKDTAPVSSTGQAIAARNGNGHKPEAAIPTEHDLLWDGLSPAVTQALGQPLDSQLVSQRKGARRQVLRLPRRPPRHRPGQPDIRLRRLGLRTGRGRHPAQDRDGQFPDRRGEGGTGLQRAGAGHRGGRPAPHRHRRPPGGGGHLRRPRHGHKGRRHGRHEAGVPQLRRPVRQRASTATSRRLAMLRSPNGSLLRANAPYWKRGQRQLRPEPGQRPQSSPRLKSCGSGSSRSPPSRASMRTRCGPPWSTGRARASTTWTAPSSGRWWKPRPTSSGRCSRPRLPSLPVNPVRNRERGRLLRGAVPLSSLQDKEATSHDND